jgi:hypothetical protein
MKTSDRGFSIDHGCHTRWTAYSGACHTWMAGVLIGVTASLTTSCGAHLTNVGVLSNPAGIAKTAVEASPPNIHLWRWDVSVQPNADALEKIVHGKLNYGGFVYADVAGDDEDEVMMGGGAKECAASASGSSASAIVVASYSGERRFLLCTQGAGRVYDFGAIHASRPDKFDLVVCRYPVEQRASRFQILTVPDLKVVATWDEPNPAPCEFTVGRWGGQDAILYWQHGDVLTVRSPRGELLARVPIPDANAFKYVDVAPLKDDAMALVGSGNGYTPFHMVCVLDREHRLMFQDIEKEGAYKIEAAKDGRAFDVWTTTTRWRYSLAD